MKNTAFTAAAAILMTIAAPAAAKVYEDYTPEKGVWNITAVEVDPSHVDDYLTGLRKSQLPGMAIMKRRGLIDDYKYVVRSSYAKGSPNVLIMMHYTSVAALAPDKARDEAIDKEIYATMSEDAGKAAVAGYEKFRSFVDMSDWSEVTFAK